MQRERIQQVRYGSALEAELIESRAHALQARQELLTADLQRSELQMQLNDVIGLPLTTPLLPDPNVSAISGPRSGVNAKRAFGRRSTRIRRSPKRARRSQRPLAAVRLAKYEFVPDVDVFARYSFQNNMPFLADRFGTVGIRASVDLFDGGRKRAVVRQRETSARAGQGEPCAYFR